MTSPSSIRESTSVAPCCARNTADRAPLHLGPFIESSAQVAQNKISVKIASSQKLRNLQTRSIRSWIMRHRSKARPRMQMWTTSRPQCPLSNSSHQVYGSVEEDAGAAYPVLECRRSFVIRQRLILARLPPNFELDIKPMTIIPSIRFGNPSSCSGFPRMIWAAIHS